MSKSRVLFQLSGSIACYKACSVISRLVQEGVEVRCAATPAALRFVGKATLEGLTGKAVFSDPYEPGRMMDHIQLARWADAAILCPATAATVNRLAAGIAEDAVSTLFLAWELGRKPYLVAPAMNHQMLSHPATQGALEKLRGWGVEVLATGAGRQACGEEGEGRLLEPEQVMERIQDVLGKGMR